MTGTVGGHAGKTWTDERLLSFLEATLAPSSFIDIGCATGGMVSIAKQHGMEAHGIDGDPLLDFGELAPCIAVHDYYEGPLVPVAVHDIGWCVEFLEHIEERFLPNVFATLRKCRHVICTASTMHLRFHVNVKPCAYWIEQFIRNGFRFRPDITADCKANTGMAPNRHIAPLNFIQATGMFFENAELLEST